MQPDTMTIVARRSPSSLVAGPGDAERRTVATKSGKLQDALGGTLEIQPKEGYLRMVLDRVFRSERRPLRSGEEVKLTEMTVARDGPHSRR